MKSLKKVFLLALFLGLPMFSGIAVETPQLSPKAEVKILEIPVEDMIRILEENKLLKEDLNRALNHIYQINEVERKAQAKCS